MKLKSTGGRISSGSVVDGSNLMSPPVLREDEQLLRVVELLQDVGEELAPPALSSTQLNQQQAGVETDLRRPTDAEVFEELLTGLGMEGTLQH